MLRFQIQETNREPRRPGSWELVYRFKGIPTSQSAVRLCAELGFPCAMVVAMPESHADDPKAYYALLCSYAKHRIADVLESVTDDDYVIA